MRGVNKAIILGNVGKDPELKYMPSGKAVCNISIATSEKWKDKATGDTKEATEWHSIVFYDKLAEIVGEYVRKGSQLYIEGKLRTRTWKDKEGRDCYKTEIMASEMQLLGGKQECQSDKQQAPSAEQASGDGEPFSDDIPFN